MKITWNSTKDILTGRFFQYYALPSITYHKNVSQEKVIHSGAIQVGVTILLCLLQCHFLTCDDIVVQLVFLFIFSFL